MTKCKVVDCDVRSETLTLDVKGKRVDCVVNIDRFFFKKWVGKDVVVSAVKKDGVAYLTSIRLDLDGAEELL
jgi:hypothetical protein